MKIDRSQLIADLMAFATSGSGVVIGQPGAGKTHALVQLRERLKADGTPHLILPVERLGAATAPEISSILGREGDFVQLLQQAVAGTAKPAVLIFDGFDAARGENERAGVFQLILRTVNELRGSWHTIVSVRTFDARKSQRLLDLFPKHTKEKEAGCRTFSIPSLTDNEVAQVFPQIDGLKAVYDAGTPEFRALLKIPFHLWLIERVLRTKIDTKELTRATSEVHLLELYWTHRVRAGATAADRDFLLKDISTAMVRNRALTARRTAVYRPELRDAWNTLLSDEVLVEVPEGEPRVAYGHNILFDFAVSLYLLDGAPEKLAKFVAEEPARPLFLRPSLVYHFTRLWLFDRSMFWRNFWTIIRQETVSLRQIVRIVLPAVVIQEARAAGDLSPLLDQLKLHTDEAHNAIAFTLQAVRVLRSGRAELWSGFLRDASLHLDRKFAWDGGMIADSCLKSGGETTVIAAHCGEFGRRLLEWAWANRNDPKTGTWFERMGGIVAVPLVAKTFTTDPKESSRLLQQVLDVIGEPDFSIDSIFRLVNELEHVIPHDPELVGKAYERVFGYEERSDAKTNMGGPVLSLISNRRQDFDSCRYSLIQDFPKFLAQAPKTALVAGIRAVQFHAIHAHLESGLKAGKTLADVTFSFSFRGQKAYFLHDMSAIWDETQYPDQEMALADAVFQWLESVAKAGREDQLDAFLDLFVREARAAFLWARLLSVAAEHPALLGPRLAELAMNLDILDARDTVVALGAYLEHATPMLPEPVRAQIETAILSLPANEEGEEKEWAERRRNRLLARIPEKSVATKAARDLWSELKRTNSLPPNTPLYSFTSSSRPYSEDDHLRERGVEPESPANAELRTLYRPLADWDSKKAPEAIDGLLASTAALRTLLANPSKADPAVKAVATTHLASFASDALLRTNQAGTERFKLLRELVIEAAASEHPETDPKADKEWNFAAWSPAPRNEAAQALPWLTRFRRDEEALVAIKRLAGDPVPSVRFLLACEIWRLQEHCSDVLWPLLKERAETEVNDVVRQGIARSLWHLIGLDAARSLELIQLILTSDDADSDDEERTSSQLISMVVDYAVERDDAWAKATIKHWQGKPVAFAASLGISGSRLIEHVKPQHAEKSAARARVLLLDHLDAAAAGIRELQKHAVQPMPEGVQKKWKALYGIINNLVMRLYFAADIDPNLRQRTEHPLSDSQRDAFFRASLPLLSKVLSFGNEPEAGVLLAPTAHYFMELLNGVVRYDPALVLHMAADVVRSSQRFNYNLDSMAMKETVQLVETLLADHRTEIRSEDSIKDLLGLLDSFIDAGWPDALNLVWRLDEIYR